MFGGPAASHAYAGCEEDGKTGKRSVAKKVFSEEAEGKGIQLVLGRQGHS